MHVKTNFPLNLEEKNFPKLFFSFFGRTHDNFGFFCVGIVLVGQLGYIKPKIDYR